VRSPDEGRGRRRTRSKWHSTSTGYRNTMTLVLTGLDVEAKAAHATSLLFGLLGTATSSPPPTSSCCAPTTRTRRAIPSDGTPRVTVMDPDRDKVGRRFSNAVTELALASYAGFLHDVAATEASALRVYWPLLVRATSAHDRRPA